MNVTPLKDAPATFARISDERKPQPTNGALFLDEIGKALESVDLSQKRADRAMEDGALKGAEDVHSAMVRLQEAELSLRLFMQVRNKAIEAYKEVMRMQM